MAGARNTVVAAILAWAGGLRFPVLLGVTAALFAVDLVTPDPIPLVDEALLGLTAVLLASWRKRREEARDPADDETPPGADARVNEER